jgi:hypothetical protein
MSFIHPPFGNLAGDNVPVSVPSLRRQIKTLAAQGNHPVATTLRDATDEIVALRSEVIKLKATIREIRSIANLSILGRA